MKGKASQAGFGLVEVMVTLGLFSGLLALFSMSLKDTARDQSSAIADAETEEMALKAMAAIHSALDQTVLSVGFPQVFDDNSMGTAFLEFVHPPAIPIAGMPGVREIVFQVPLDADSDGWPDTDTDGSLLWDPLLRALVVTPDATGSNRLYLMHGNGTRRTLARNIGSLVLDTSASSGFAFPLDQIRVRLQMAPLEGRPAAAFPVPFESHVKLPQLDEALW